jgi:hypothetical protein
MARLSMVIRFFVVAALLTWLAWVPAALIPNDVDSSAGRILLYVGGLGPVVALVVVLTSRISTRCGRQRRWWLWCYRQEGLVTSIWSPAHYRDVNGVQTLTPWQGRLRAYALHAGMRIPLEGEIEWQLPGGPVPYWRGRITEMAYELAR